MPAQQPLTRAAAALLLVAALACSDEPTAPAQPPQVAAVTINGNLVVLEEGTARLLSADARDRYGNRIPGVPITWRSTDQRVVRVAGDGTLTAVGAGRARVVARAGVHEALATVDVKLTIGFDLLFDAWTVGGNAAQPRLLRLDVRDGEARTILPATYAPADVAPSPDGTRIAFVASSGGNTDLFVANRDGTGIRQLTTTAENEDQPAWSPDGSALAFRRWTHTTRARIWVMSADGANARALVADGDAADQQRPAWSPWITGAGPRLAWVRVTRGADGYVRGQLRTARADGTDVREVTTGDAFDDQPSWSPDGQTIVFVRTGGTSDGELFLVDAAGGNERPLLVAKPEGAQRAPVWSPDGRHVAFASAHDLDATGYAYQIYTVRADGAQLVRRTWDLVEKDNPAWIRRALLRDDDVG